MLLGKTIHPSALDFSQREPIGVILLDEVLGIGAVGALRAKNVHSLVPLQRSGERHRTPGSVHGQGGRGGHGGSLGLIDESILLGLGADGTSACDSLRTGYPAYRAGLGVQEGEVVFSELDWSARFARFKRSEHSFKAQTALSGDLVGDVIVIPKPTITGFDRHILIGRFLISKRPFMFPQKPIALDVGLFDLVDLFLYLGIERGFFGCTLFKHELRLGDQLVAGE